jgi:hypothetical protein
LLALSLPDEAEKFSKGCKLDIEDLNCWYQSYEFLHANRTEVFNWYQNATPVYNISKEKLISAPGGNDVAQSFSYSRAWVTKCENEAFIGGLRHAKIIVDGKDRLLFRRDINVWKVEEKFLTQNELSVNHLLGLHFDWITAARDGYVLQHLDEPIFSFEKEHLRIGVCSLISTSDIKIHYQPFPNNEELKQLFRVSHNDKTEVNGRVKTAFDAAVQAEVDILIFPELSILDEALAQLRELLSQSNGSIKLLVAGSCHTDSENGYSNKCTLLGKYGEDILCQDKLNIYYYEESGGRKTYEHSDNDKTMRVLDAGGFRIAVPICIDYFYEDPWNRVLKSTSLILVPAMSPNLVRFEDRARMFGNLTRAVTVVANASRISAPDAKDGGLFYKPSSKEPVSRFAEGKKTKSEYLTFWDIGIRDQLPKKSTDN